MHWPFKFCELVGLTNPSKIMWPGAKSHQLITHSTRYYIRESGFSKTWVIRQPNRPLLIPFGWFSIVSPMCSLSFYAHVFFRSNGGNFRRDWVSEGILRWCKFVTLTHLYWRNVRRNSFYAQYSRSSGLVHPRARSTYTAYLASYWLHCCDFDHYFASIKIQTMCLTFWPPLRIIPPQQCWCLPVILTLRTWAMWNRNQRLSVILPVLYSVCWGSALIITVRFGNSITSKWKLDARSWWIIQYMVVGAPPYLGFKGCFVKSVNQNILSKWVLLLVWDARKCKCIIKFSSSNWKGSIVDAPVGIRHPSMWAIFGFEDRFSTFHILNIRQIWGQHLPNESGVSRRSARLICRWELC